MLPRLRPHPDVVRCTLPLLKHRCRPTLLGDHNLIITIVTISAARYIYRELNRIQARSDRQCLKARFVLPRFRLCTFELRIAPY
jgi:hypothetical protein